MWRRAPWLLARNYRVRCRNSVTNSSLVETDPDAQALFRNEYVNYRRKGAIRDVSCAG